MSTVDEFQVADIRNGGPRCPECKARVEKVLRYGQLSYSCGEHWGPWEDAVKPPQSDAFSEQGNKP